MNGYVKESNRTPLVRVQEALKEFGIEVSVTEDDKIIIRGGQKYIPTETTVEGTAGIASNFTTYETPDNRYKLSLYETVDLAEVEGISGEKRQGGKLKFAEDYNLDGELEEVKYSDHWSWIYTLRNNPEDASGTHIWEWAAAVE